MSALLRRTLLAAPALALHPAHAQGNELRLGAIFPFSGGLALLADEYCRGLELAVEERNASGGLLGRPLRLLKADATDATQATTEARRLLGTDRAALLFGGLSSPVAQAAAAVAEAQGSTYCELAANADSLTERGQRGLFRTAPRATELAQATLRATTTLLAPHWRKPPGAIAIALLHEEGSFGQAMATAQEAETRQQGLTLVAKLSYPGRTAAMPELLLRLREAGAELVLHAGIQNDILLFFRAMQQMGWRPRQVLGAGAGYSLADVAQGIGTAFDGTLTMDVPPLALPEVAAPGAARLAEAYARRWASPPRSGHSLAGYVGARAVLEAAQRASGLERDKLRPALLALDVPEGGCANGWGLRLDEKGQNSRAHPVLAQWQGGSLRAVWPAAAAMAPLSPP